MLQQTADSMAISAPLPAHPAFCQQAWPALSVHRLSHWQNPRDLAEPPESAAFCLQDFSFCCCTRKFKEVKHYAFGLSSPISFSSAPTAFSALSMLRLHMMTVASRFASSLTVSNPMPALPAEASISD